MAAQVDARLCRQCQQTKPASEFTEGKKWCDACRAAQAAVANDSIRRRQQAGQHLGQESGVSDEDIRSAYMKLWHSYRDGSGIFHGADLGPAIDILVSARNAEPASSGCYRLTDQGKTTWAYMASQFAGRFDIDQELMKRANWIMSAQGFLELLEHGEWITAPRQTAYATRKECRDNGWVETQGKTANRQYRISADGRAELARLRTEDAPSFVDHTERVTPINADDLLDQVTADNVHPEAFIETTIAIDWQHLASERLARITQLEELLTQRDGTIIQYDQQMMPIFAFMSEDEAGFDSLLEYVTALRQGLANETSIVESINKLAAQDGKADMGPEEYVQWLRNHYTRIKPVYELMQASRRNYQSPREYVEVLQQRLADAENRVDPDLEHIMSLAIEDGRGDLSPVDYVEFLRQQAIAFEDAQLRLCILDELRNASPAIYRYIQGRQMADSSLRQILNGEGL